MLQHGTVLADHTHAPCEIEDIVITLARTLNNEELVMRVINTYSEYDNACDELMEDGIYTLNPTVVLRQMLAYRNSDVLAQLILDSLIERINDELLHSWLHLDMHPDYPGLYTVMYKEFFDV